MFVFLSFQYLFSLPWSRGCCNQGSVTNTGDLPCLPLGGAEGKTVTRSAKEGGEPQVMEAVPKPRGEGAAPGGAGAPAGHQGHLGNH